MPRYKITDNDTGTTLVVSGDQPPTEEDAAEIFASPKVREAQAKLMGGAEQVYESTEPFRSISRLQYDPASQRAVARLKGKEEAERASSGLAGLETKAELKALSYGENIARAFDFIGAVGKLLRGAGTTAEEAVKKAEFGQNPLEAIAHAGEETSTPGAQNAFVKGIEGMAKSTPMIAGAMAMQSAGVPMPLAFGTLSTAQALDEGADVGQAITAGAIGAAIPESGAIAKAGASKLLVEAIDRGITSASRPIVQKSVEALASQGGMQLFMAGVDLPKYIAAAPDERKKMLVENVTANSAWLLMEAPGLLSKVQSHTQASQTDLQRAAEAMHQMVRNPVYLDEIEKHIDRQVIGQMMPSGVAAAVQQTKQAGAPATAAALAEQAIAPKPQPEKGPNAVQPESPQLLRPVRNAPGEGAREVPVEGAVTKDDERGREGGAKAPEPEAPAKPDVAAVPPLRPAINAPGGYYTGRTHSEAIGEARGKGESIPDDNEHLRGYLLPDNTFIPADSEQAKAIYEKETGKPFDKDRRLHSEDLISSKLLPVDYELEKVEKPAEKPAPTAPASAEPAPPTEPEKAKGAKGAEAAPKTNIVQAPEPESFNSIADILKFRKKRLEEERQLYQEQIGITAEQAKRLQELLMREGETTRFEKTLSPNQRKRLEAFFDGPFNQRAGPWKSWETDRRLNPAEIAEETDPDLLASALVSAVERGVEEKPNSDRFISAVIAARRLKELGKTKSDIAKYLDRYTTRESSSQGDKVEFFKNIGSKVNAFLARQGIDLPEGELSSKPQPAPPTKTIAQPSEAPTAKPAVESSSPAAAAKAAETVSKIAAKQGAKKARQAKEGIVDALEDEIDSVIKESEKETPLVDRGDGRYVAGTAYGDIVEEDGKFKVTVSGGPGRGKAWYSSKEDSLEDARRVIAAAGAVGKGKATISIPNDGEFTVVRSGPELLELRDRAARIKTTSQSTKPVPSGGEGKLSEQADKIVKAYGSPEAAYQTAVRQKNALQSQEPPRDSAGREEWNSQIQAADALIGELYPRTKAGVLETKAEKARDSAATYREGAQSFRDAIAKIEKVKRKTARHKQELADLQSRLEENQKRLAEFERNAESFEQQAAKEKAALEPESEAMDSESLVRELHENPDPTQADLDAVVSKLSDADKKKYAPVLEIAKRKIEKTADLAARNVRMAQPDTGVDLQHPPEESITTEAPPPEPAAVGPGMGGAIPQEFEQSPRTPTSIKNATVDQERATRGLPPAIQPLKRSFGEVWDRAMAMIDHDPDTQDRLIADLKAKPRALNDTEDALLLHRQVDLQNEYGKATRDLALAHDEGRTEAAETEKIRVANLSDKLQELYDIGKQVGTETGRGLNARKMMAYEDFTLAKMMLDKRAAVGGRPLTDGENAEIARLHGEIERAQKAFEDYRTQSENRLREEAMKRAMAESAKGLDIHPKVLEAARKIVSTLDKKADAARERIRARMGRTTAGVDPTVLLDLAEIGASHLAHKIVDAAEWGAKMIADVGEWVRPHLDEVRAKAEELLNTATAGKPEPVKTAIRGMSVPEAKEAVGKAIKDKMDRKQKEKIPFMLQQLARLLYANGITEREAMVDALHEVMQGADPNITRREVMDAFSGYGDYKTLTKDQITVALRGMKGELQQLAKLEDMAKGVPPAKSGVERRTPTEAERQLIKRVNDAKFRFQVPVQDPETQLKSALDTMKTTLANRIKDYEQRLADKEFDPRPRRTLELDADAMRLKAAAERVKKRFREALLADRLKNRTNWEKAADMATKYRRFGVLSSPVVLPKLISAGLQRLATLPLEDLAGTAYRRLPGVTGVAEKAPLEGAGLNLKAEMTGYGAAFTKGMKDAYDVIRKGHTDLDVLYGKAAESYTGEYEFGSRMLALPGRIHGMLKAPVKRAAFERAVQRLGEFYAKQGLDPNDEFVKTRIAVEAYKAANAAIFLQDNFIASKVSAFLSQKIDKTTGHATPGSKAWSTAGRVALPIVRVPLNIVGETMQYVGGLASAPVRLMAAYSRGIENLKPEQADLIMRELKKGSLGAAVLLLGYFNPNVVGGYYQPGKKREKGDVPAGSIRVYGHDVPSWLLHNPLLETAQIGATVRRVSESYLRKKDTEPQGLAAGVMAAAWGLVEQVPFIREELEIEKLRNPYTRARWLQDQAKSVLIPAAVQKAAEWQDQGTKRKPETIGQTLETGIPWLRQQVPAAPAR